MPKAGARRASSPRSSSSTAPRRGRLAAARGDRRARRGRPGAAGHPDDHRRRDARNRHRGPARLAGRRSSGSSPTSTGRTSRSSAARTRARPSPIPRSSPAGSCWACGKPASGTHLKLPLEEVLTGPANGACDPGPGRPGRPARARCSARRSTSPDAPLRHVSTQGCRNGQRKTRPRGQGRVAELTGRKGGRRPDLKVWGLGCPGADHWRQWTERYRPNWREAGRECDQTGEICSAVNLTSTPVRACVVTRLS